MGTTTLTNTQLLKAMVKTDKAISDFLSNCHFIDEYNDVTNSAKLKVIQKAVTELLDDLGEDQY